MNPKYIVTDRTFRPRWSSDLSVPFTLYSEKYPPTGGMSGNAIRRNLGRSHLDNLSVLIREAVQNSWDARLDPAGSIRFDAHLGSLLPDQVGILQSHVFTGLPEGHPLRAILRTRLPLRRLILRDRGTFGLNGPVFHVPKTPGTPRNFMRFLRDIGRGASEALGGGTYGFGKSCLFTASEVSTIIVHTRYRDASGSGPAGERLMAASLCNPPDDESLTGRHWWGIPSDVDGVAAVGPAEGKVASRLAKALGFPPFAEEESGTSIMILKPRVWESDGVSLTAEQIAETMVAWFWPRMLPQSNANKSPFIDFTVWGDDGGRVKVPDPRSVPWLTPFVEGFCAWQARTSETSGATGTTQLITCETFRPQARVGYVAMGAYPQPPASGWQLSAVDSHPLAELLGSSEAQPRVGHVALMRSTWQVIRYHECGRATTDPGRCYGGIFMVDPDRQGVEEAFAQSEPPSHDEWVEGSLSQKADKTYVRAHRKTIATAVDALFEREFSGAQGAEVSPRSLDALSHDLGLLLGGRLAAPITKGARPRGALSRPAFSLKASGSGKLEQQDGGRVLILPFYLKGTLPEEGIRVRANLHVMVDGGGCEKEPPSGLISPRVVRWEDMKGNQLSEGDHCQFGPGLPTQGRVVVAIPEDSLVKVMIFTEQA